jgi:hypothetical protein
MPFVQLGWAVTGKMVGGKRALRQTISREDALIAFHAQERVVRVPGEQHRIDPGREARGT